MSELAIAHAAPRLRVLVVDEMHTSLLPLLAEIGVAADYQPTLAPAAVAPTLAAGAYEGLVVRSKLFVDADFLRATPSLRVICRAGAGVDNVDESALAAAGVTLLNAPEGNRAAVGEFAVGLLLALLRHIPRADAEVRRGEWRREANRGTELGELTVGILGYGHMGSAFAQRLRGFGGQVLAHDLIPEKVTDGFASYVSLQELRTRADVVSLHVPLTAATRRLVDTRWLAACQRPIWLLNTARGEVVDTPALVAALRSGQVRGAALDVLENEKLDMLTHEQAADLAYLQTHPRVVLTPHVGGWTDASYERINQVLVKKLNQWLPPL